MTMSGVSSISGGGNTSDAETLYDALGVAETATPDEIKQAYYRLVRQYRPGAGRAVLELPAGMLDPADQSPATAAERELLEETGYRPRRVEPLAALYPSPARQSNRTHCFLAIGCQEVALPAGDPAEDNIAVSLLALDDLRTLARSGGLPSQTSLACLFLGIERLRDLNLA